MKKSKNLKNLSLEELDDLFDQYEEQIEDLRQMQENCYNEKRRRHREISSIDNYIGKCFRGKFPDDPSNYDGPSTCFISIIDASDHVNSGTCVVVETSGITVQDLPLFERRKKKVGPFTMEVEGTTLLEDEFAEITQAEFLSIMKKVSRELCLMVKETTGN